MPPVDSSGAGEMPAIIRLKGDGESRIENIELRAARDLAAGESKTWFHADSIRRLTQQSRLVVRPANGHAEPLRLTLSLRGGRRALEGQHKVGFRGKEITSEVKEQAQDRLKSCLR